jgi:hypothetical protein
MMDWPNGIYSLIKELKKMKRILTLLFLSALSFSSLSAVGTPVFKANGKTFSITGFVEIKADGKVLYTDKEIMPLSKQHSYSHLSFAPHTFITINFNDGIDIDQSRLFSIKGSTVVEYPILTSHEENEFFIKAGSLYYWSSSFCGFKDPRSKAENSYVLVFKNNKFDRKPVSVPAYHNCEAEFIKKQI